MKRESRYSREESLFKKKTKRLTFYRHQDKSSIKELEATFWKTCQRQFLLQTIRQIELELKVEICFFLTIKLRALAVIQ